MNMSAFTAWWICIPSPSRQDPAEFRKEMREHSYDALYCGRIGSRRRTVIYYQSHVSGHAELAWILNCFTYMGELNRMTQFKDKAAKHADNINAGLFTYPVSDGSGYFAVSGRCGSGWY